MPLSRILAGCLFGLVLLTTLAPARSEEPPFDYSRFEKTSLTSGLMRPMELAVAPDGRVFYIELDGKLKLFDPATKETTLLAEIKVTTEQENGLIGLALDPKFAENHWIYLQYSPPDFPGQHVSRFTMVDDKLDLDSEKLLLKYEEQRRECCHHAGSLEFGPGGLLYIGTGDNTHPAGDSQGYAPIDERPGQEPWDAQKSASNTNSYNGKVLRIRPLADGTVEIPEGNLFPFDGSAGRPEIYAMGCRNPWRINVDQRTGYLYWGEVGPDAGGDGPRGPRGYDEINQAKQAGNFGWPYFIANNRAYHDVDFATGKIGAKYDVAGPVNESPNNTGARVLPAPTPAFLYYPYGDSEEFPILGKGGRTACAGPVYYYDDYPESDTKFPRHFDRSLFIFEWTRHWIKAVHLDQESNLAEIESFMPEQPFVRPIDMQFGPEGSLYLIEYGESWGVNPEARLVRIDYVRGNRSPQAQAAAENNIGKQPLEVTLSSEGTFDKDPGDKLSYEWRVHQAATETEKPQVNVVSREPNAKVTFEHPGVFNVELVVTDSQGAQGAASVPVLVGNGRPTVRFVHPREGDFIDPGQPLRYELIVDDAEDGTNDFDRADELDLDLLDPDAPNRVSVNARMTTAPQNAAEAEGPPGMRMMKRSDCFNCHAVDQKRVGPPLLEIADKYRDKPGAIEQSIERVLKGSTGAWGKIPMIPHSQHTPAEVGQMVSWVYSLQGASAVRVYNGFVGDISLPADEAQAGAYFNLEASYVDRGFGEVPPLGGTASLLLRGRMLEAEHADLVHGPQVLESGSASGGKFIGAINHQHYLLFKGIRLDQVKHLKLKLASAGAGGQVEVRQDQVDGKLLATVDVEVNGQWEQFYEREVALEGATGKHDLYFVFVNAQRQGGLMNFDSVYFAGE